MTQATASSDLGWLYIDGRKSVIVKMLPSLDLEDFGAAILRGIASAAHDLEATGLTWSSECISVSWDLGQVSFAEIISCDLNYFIYFRWPQNESKPVLSLGTRTIKAVFSL